MVRGIALALAFTLLIPVAAVAQTTADADRDAPYPREVVPPTIGETVPVIGSPPDLVGIATVVPTGIIDPKAEECAGPALPNSVAMHECPDEYESVDEASWWMCMLGMQVGNYDHCSDRPVTCELRREYTKSTSWVERGVRITETETMCDYGDCGEMNIALARR